MENKNVGRRFFKLNLSHEDTQFLKFVAFIIPLAITLRYIAYQYDIATHCPDGSSGPGGTLTWTDPALNTYSARYNGRDLLQINEGDVELDVVSALPEGKLRKESAQIVIDGPSNTMQITETGLLGNITYQSEKVNVSLITNDENGAVCMKVKH